MQRVLADRDSLGESLLNSILAHVLAHGWTSRAMHEGVRNSGQHAGVLGLAFPDGISDVARAMFRRADDACVTVYETIQKRASSNILPSVRERIAKGVMAWFVALEPHRDAVRLWLAGIPLHPLTRLSVTNRALWNAADIIWSSIAVNASPSSFMSRRLLLMGVLKVTLPIWLADTTDDSMLTRAFVMRRLDNVVHAGKTLRAITTITPRDISNRVRETLHKTRQRWSTRERARAWV